MTFITAEIGINHNGSIEIAKKLIDVASSAGCDAVKFQKRNVEKVYSKKVLDTYRESMWGTTTRKQKLGLEFSEKQYTEIDQYCKKKKYFGICLVGMLIVKFKCESSKQNITRLLLPCYFIQNFWKLLQKRVNTHSYQPV